MNSADGAGDGGGDGAGDDGGGGTYPWYLREDGRRR